jgi:hypothetical protein
LIFNRLNISSTANTSIPPREKMLRTGGADVSTVEDSFQ